MSRQTLALLVGINDYADGVPKLSGCLNDVDRFHDYLRRRVDPKGLAVQVLKDGDATRDNIIGQFREHLGRARKGDVAVFHYCGHGAQSPSDPAFLQFDPSGLDEGLVCIDSRKSGGYDLADKELAILIGELARTEAHVAFILDACHSGSGTRSADAYAGLRSRMTRGGTKARPLASYLEGRYSKMHAKRENLSIPAARHILLAACERRQEAKESPADRSGVFTSTLLEVLEKSKDPLSYADLFVRCRAAVRKRAVDQDPQFETAGGFDAWSGFLGGASARAARPYSVYFDKGAWRIDAGAIHGLPDQPDQPASLALADERDASRSAGTARTVEVGPQQSLVELDFECAEDARFSAALTSMPAAPLLLHVQAEAGLREKLETALQGGAVPGVAVTDEAGSAHYALEVQDGKLALVQREWGLVIQAALLDPSRPEAALAVLAEPIQKVSQWERLLALRNRSSEIDPASIDLVCSESASPAVPTAQELARGEEATLESVNEAGEWSEIRARVLARNKSGQPLHLLLMHFEPDFGVSVLHNAQIPSGNDWVTLYGSRPDDAFRLEDTLEDGGESEESIDRFKLIASTERVDDFLLVQEGVDLGKTLSGTRALGSKNRKKTRSQDWVTKSLRVRVSPRLSEVGTKTWTSDNGAIVVKRHSKIKANVSMGSARPSTRSATEGAPFLDAFERAGLGVASFGHTRGGDLGVLELSGIENAQSLATEPFEIELNTPLEANEVLLPIVFDGNHVLLAGEVSKDEQGHTHISIDHLPEAPTDRRSLGSALKMYFFKTYLKQKDPNLLRWVEYGSGDGFTCHDTGLVEKVAAARRVLLLVHGIIGDTEGMAQGVRGCGLEAHFDLVLTYDYENLATPIRQTAANLKARLAAVGLHAGDDKHLTLLVHSMGGLVSRWFIEREGGNRVVDHLVMCGTPNSGSPFGKVDDARKILTLLTGLAANYVPALLPFSAPILFALNGSRKVTPTLMEMDPSSAFITELNASPDPGVPYTILAGDVKAYDDPTDKFFAKLVAKVGQSFVFDALFGNRANDIAVAIESIERVGGARAHAPFKRQVACHHLNYFDSPAGQEALKKVAWS